MQKVVLFNPLLPWYSLAVRLAVIFSFVQDYTILLHGINHNSLMEQLLLDWEFYATSIISSIIILLFVTPVREHIQQESMGSGPPTQLHNQGIGLDYCLTLFLCA